MGRRSGVAGPAAFALGTGVALGQPAAPSAYLLPTPANPAVTTAVEGTATWQEVDFGTGPAIAAWLSFPTLGAEAMFVLQAAGRFLDTNSHRFAFVTVWPEGDVPGPVSDGRLIEASPALGVPVSRSFIEPLSTQPFGDHHFLPLGALESNMALLGLLRGVHRLCDRLLCRRCAYPRHS